MLDAHHLESKVAQYPRLVVGPGVMNYLDAINRQTGTHFAIQATKAGAQECRRYLTQDEDGKWIVDYLGQAIATVGGNEDRFRRSQAKAFEFVVQELGRFRTSKTTTLIERYERLEAYFKSRGSK
ncbi:MAG: hypothetical protein IPK83_04255 [Planctomycetes bacterium]|nr:hypothetical protein [Planctomycetota bacterium]